MDEWVFRPELIEGGTGRKAMSFTCMLLVRDPLVPRQFEYVFHLPQLQQPDLPLFFLGAPLPTGVNLLTRDASIIMTKFPKAQKESENDMGIDCKAASGGSVLVKYILAVLLSLRRKSATRTSDSNRLGWALMDKKLAYRRKLAAAIQTIS